MMYDLFHTLSRNAGEDLQSKMDAQSVEADAELDAFSEFLAKYPAYKDTMIIDSLRCEEYPHLDERGQACLDYTGVGLFSGSQVGKFGIECCHTPSNLATHAMYADDGSIESYFRRRVLHYLNLDEEDYYIVFTANAFSAFKLLGTSYPFHEAPNLLLAYDHKCENRDALSDCCLAKCGSVHSVALLWPWCIMDANDLEKKLHCKRKVCMQKGGARRGLFAFPYSSRVTGCRSASRWIPQAQQNGWHVLLDVTSIDAKMLDSLGLSLFLPEFVICSLYNVFGEDPTGLGCLAVKKSVLRTLGDSSRARAIGMVTIMNKPSSGLMASDSSVSGSNEFNHRSRAPSGDSAGLSDLQDPKKSSLHQPDWSVDLTAIDNTWFYQYNGDVMNQPKEVLQEDDGKGGFFRHSNSVDSSWSKEVLHEEDGIGDVHAKPTQRNSCNYGKEVPENDILCHDGMIDSKENVIASVPQVHRGIGSSSFSVWMANQGVHTGASFRSVSAREHSESDFHFPSTSYSHMGNGRMWQNGALEIEEFEPLPFYSSSRLTNGQAPDQVHPKSLKRHSSKGLFSSNVGTIYPASRTSLRRLFRCETKANIREHLQKAGQVHSGVVLTVRDWVAYYSEKARLLNSVSSSASSSFRFGTEDEHDRDTMQRKATKTVFVQNKITCKGLDHADLLGYRRVAVRLRSLAEWLISALSQLQHPPPESSKLVKLWSRISLAERPSTVAFSLTDSSGNAFDVKRVQLLADRSNVSIRTGVIEGTFIMDSERDQHHEERLVGCMELSAGYKCLSKDGSMQRLEMPVLYVSLGFLNNFSDVYRLWRFVCRFLDPQFVNQELWHYQALNQETVEI